MVLFGKKEVGETSSFEAAVLLPWDGTLAEVIKTVSLAQLFRAVLA